MSSFDGIGFDGLGCENFFVLLFACLSVAWRIQVRTKSWLAAIVFFLSCLSALQHSNSSLAYIFMVTGAVWALDSETWRGIFGFLAIVNSLMIIIGAFFGKPFGLLLNASMSGCFAAALLPMTCGHRKLLPWMQGLIAVSVLMTQQSMPIAIMFLTFGVFLIFRRDWLLLLAAIAGSVGVGYLFVGPELFYSHGRTVVWKLCMEFWRWHGEVWFGTGLGTFLVIGPQLTEGAGPPGWQWMHSDWYQVLFEMGRVGLFFIASLYLLTLWLARKNHGLFICLIAYGAFASANMPLRYPISAIWGVLLIRLAMEESRTVSVASQFYCALRSTWLRYRRRKA